MQAACILTRKSTSVDVFKFGGGVVSCQSKRQSVVALSTTEAEYYAMCKAVMESAWLRYVFTELGWNSKDVKTVKIFGDNQGSLSLAQNPEFHQRTKHIEVKHHYIREQRDHRYVRF
jgi:hypothetical protein